MSTVSQRFDEFMQRLELTAAERDQASRQQNELRDRLRTKLGGIISDVLVGSFARRTAIRPLNDIDLFLTLDRRVHGGRREHEPTVLLEDAQRALRDCYPPPGPKTQIQGRSVNIEFVKTGIGYDVIPAFLLPSQGSADVYEIPDRNQKGWIKTNPKVHEQRCIAANEIGGGMLNRLIKAVKCWNRLPRDNSDHKPLRSFHLEVMAYEAFRAKPADERMGLRDLFAFLASRVASRCPDPAGLGPDVDRDMSAEEREQARNALQIAAELANEAIHREHSAEYTKACASWRALLGPTFPDEP